MAYKAKKTEHAGAKHGNGAYWGPKQEAKKESDKTRRRNWKHEVREALRDLQPLPTKNFTTVSLSADLPHSEQGREATGHKL